MSLAVFFTALIESLKRELEWYNDDGLTLHLYVNDVDPTSDTELDDFTECSASWYGSVTIDEWDVDGVTYISPRAVGTHPQVIFTPDGVDSAEVYGYYTRNSLGGLEFSEQFVDGPYTVGAAPSQALAITPKKTRRSEFHST